MEMPLVRLENRHAAAIAADDGKRRIEDGKAEREDRHDERDRRGRLHGADDADARQHIAEEHAARIAHKDARGIEVVIQEADGRARDRRAEHGDEHDALLQRDEEDRRRRDARHASREAVEAVDEVHRIREADDPEHRRGDREPFEEQVIAERIGDEVDAHVKTDDEHARRDDLADELHFRRQILVIVDEAEQHDERAADHEPLELERDIRLDRHLVHDGQHRRHEREVDAEAADARHRPLVHLARVRRIHRARLLREKNNAWRHEESHTGSNDERQNVIRHKLVAPL